MRHQFYTVAVLSVFIFFTINYSAQLRTQTYGKISEITKLSEARASHSATLLKNGTVLIAGGMERNGIFFDSADIFDPKTNNFTPAKNKMSVKRVSR